MSDICSPESETASFTAVNAWAASGVSAERVTLEKPTPLTATLHRFSHMWPLLLHSAGGFLARRNCGKVMSSFSLSKTTSTRRPTFASV